MSGWPTATLEDISISGGQYGANLSAHEPRPGQPRYIRITDIGDYGALNITRVGAQASSSEIDKFSLRDGDLLFARSGATVGKTYLHSSENSPAIYAGYLIRFQIDQQVAYPRYVFHFCQTIDYANWVDANSRTVAQPNINAKQYAKLRIPLPPLPEQRRIAAILDHADALRTKRHESLCRLNDLKNATFLSMFGDPIDNERGWPVASLDEVFEKIVAGRNLVGQSDTSDGLKVLKVSAVTSLTYNESERKPLPQDYVPPPEHFVRTGDLLFSRANTSELVGATALVDATDGKTVLPDKLWRLKLAQEYAETPNFIAALMQRPAFRTRVSDLATGSSGSMKNISKAKLSSIHVGMPPLEDRIQYNCLHTSVSGELHKARAHTEHLDTLFASIQSRAFGGEL